MRIAFIGDIMGRPGRQMVKSYLGKFKEQYGLDFVIANYENASHGFGLTKKNAAELFAAGVDVMTGGNHTWDKSDIFELLKTQEILRPHNYPEGVEGTGCKVYEVGEEKLAVINLMGTFTMPQVDNPYICANKTVDALREEGVENIFIDYHAESTSEKAAMFVMLQEKVSAIIGTHTHVGTDDFQISKGTAFMCDIGLTGCRDQVIGVAPEAALERFLTGLPNKFSVPNGCKKILQIAVMDIKEGQCTHGFKIKQFDDGRMFETEAWHD